jgi:hypothetical protein
LLNLKGYVAEAEKKSLENQGRNSNTEQPFTQNDGVPTPFIEM